MPKLYGQIFKYICCVLLYVMWASAYLTLIETVKEDNSVHPREDYSQPGSYSILHYVNHDIWSHQPNLCTVNRLLNLFKILFTLCLH